MTAVLPAGNLTVPRLGFIGVGWIGLHRMTSLVESGLAEAAAFADPDPERSRAAQAQAPGALCVEGIEQLLALDLDGLVIATPSALHAGQAIAALETGKAVFCQKPLGRTGPEVRAVIEAARKLGKPLGVDLSYRHTAGMGEMRKLVQSGGLGRIFAVDLVFHNAYGPDKPWFRDPQLSGGGCMIDLGTHLIDLALWVLREPEVEHVSSTLFSQGEPVSDPDMQVEDYAAATFRLCGGTEVRITCSWNLHAGQDAVISADFHGTLGGASFRNVDGSFYDFIAERYQATARTVLASGPDEWGGRALQDWARRLGARESFSEDEAARLLQLAEVLDRIYRRSLI